MFGHTADRDPPGPAMFRGGRWSWVGDDEADAQVVVGPSFVRCDYVADRIPAGPPTAPRAAEFWRFADRELGLGVEPVSPAPDPFAP